MSLSDKLQGVTVGKRRKEPLWKGPESSDNQGGITQSLLARFLSCRERFRLYAIEGLASAQQFNHRLEYGTMWHICEEYWAKKVNGAFAFSVLKDYCVSLCRQFPLQQEQINHWYNVCKTQFPIAVEWWKRHPRTKEKTPLLQEVSFRVPYKLPSGRTVYLRGKWDAVDLVDGKVWIVDHKTKGDIDEQQMTRNLTFDIQTMFYVVALDKDIREGVCGQGSIQSTQWNGQGVGGIIYNVIRRPLSGGKHTIRQHQPTKSNPRGESSEEFYRRLGELIASDPEYFFMRWEVEIARKDIELFRKTCLDPILESISRWYEMIKECSVRGHNPFELPNNDIHWRHPFGAVNWLDEGYSSDLDEYLKSGGSEVGLRRVDSLFTELE